MKKIIAAVLLLALGNAGFAQAKTSSDSQNQGKVFFYWGWNRGFYSNSDIHLKGNDYDFTLHDVKATDRPTPFSPNIYFNPKNMTLPQTNFRLGYFVHENYTLSFGFDHMKYVVVQDQHVRIAGEIAGGGTHDKTYDGVETVQLSKDFLKFEHTNGLNYVSLEANRFDNISHLLGINTRNFQVNLIGGVGVGFLYPKTYSSVLGKSTADQFHLSGYGVSAKVAINFTIYKNFFIQSELKAGYINMPDIRTTTSSEDSASQSFRFLQPTILLGSRFHIF